MIAGHPFQYASVEAGQVMFGGVGAALFILWLAWLVATSGGRRRR